MNAKERANRRGRIFAAIVLAVFVVYPLSVGPATFVLTFVVESAASPFDMTFYRPLTRLPEPALEALKWWSRRWKEPG